MKIRSTLAIAALAASLATAALAQAIDRLGVPGPISFGEQSYALAWSAEPSPGYVKQEYVPQGQTVEAYKQMILVERVAGSVKVADAVRAQTEMLNKRKGTDPLVNMDVIQNEATGEILLDFIVSDKNAKGDVIVEWNGYRYAPLKAGEGVVLFGVSNRATGIEEARTFLTNLKTTRPATIKALTEAPIPQPTN